MLALHQTVVLQVRMAGSRPFGSLEQLVAATDVCIWFSIAGADGWFSPIRQQVLQDGPPHLQRSGVQGTHSQAGLRARVAHKVVSAAYAMLGVCCCWHVVVFRACIAKLDFMPEQRTKW
jgi:hypothetical protein